LEALRTADPSNAELSAMLFEAHAEAHNISGALDHLQPLILEAEDQRTTGAPPGEPIDTLTLALVRAHVMATRGGMFDEAERAQRELLRIFAGNNKTFACMHFVEIPGVNARMALDNARRLHAYALQASYSLHCKP
jgi:hypothetical protein